MHLLLVVLHSEELLDELLTVLVEEELPDALVLESRSGLELLERDLPIFAGLRSLIPGGLDFTRMVVTVIESDDLAAEVMDQIRQLEVPHAGGEPANTAVLVPISRTVHF